MQVTSIFSLFPQCFESASSFKFDENSRKFSKQVENTVGKQVENTVGKGEIDRYEQFLLFPQCFQKACFLEAGLGGKR